MDWLFWAIGPLFAVIGAIMLVMQKKQKLNPIVSAEEAGGRVISGGGIMLGGMVYGTVMLYKVSVIAAGAYFVLVFIVYILIHLLIRKK